MQALKIVGEIHSKTYKAISDALLAVNNGADRHTFSAPDIYALAKEAEARLEKLRVPKTFRKGCRMWAISGGTLPTSYGYNPIRTEVIIERRRSGWYLTATNRTERFGSRVPHSRVTLTPAASEAGWKANLREAYTDVQQDSDQS